jgi:hypothetical protein
MNFLVLKMARKAIYFLDILYYSKKSTNKEYAIKYSA